MTERCCEAMREDGWCWEHNPLGGSYAAVKAEIAADEAAGRIVHRPNTRKEVRWGRRQGSAGWGRQRRG